MEYNNNNNNKYWIAWSPMAYERDYNGDELSKVVDLIFFLDSNGFEQEDIEKVEALGIDEYVFLFNDILVRRVK